MIKGKGKADPLLN